MGNDISRVTNSRASDSRSLDREVNN